jgi:alkylhydroperoxidase/carboxymuconolactone decarboxylase family protein YurZ
MGKLEQDFAAYRERMNARILEENNRVIKRVYSVDSLAYSEEAGGELPRQTRDLLGLVASLVLRCDDCRRIGDIPNLKSVGDIPYFNAGFSRAAATGAQR